MTEYFIIGLSFFVLLLVGYVLIAGTYLTNKDQKNEEREKLGLPPENWKPGNETK